MHPILKEIEAVLSTTPERWQRLIGALSLDLLTRPPAQGEWSALNCLQHLFDAERRLFPVRFQAFLAGENFVPFDPNQPPSDIAALSPEELVVAFTHAREKSLALLETVRDEDLSRTVQHPQFGTVTLVQMLHTWAGHDLMHTVQAERALMQPFMLACGPWRAFFSDHEVKNPGA